MVLGRRHGHTQAVLCRVGLQLEPNDKGLGVLGVVEADFLIPTHNKQDFDDTPTYRSISWAS